MAHNLNLHESVRCSILDILRSADSVLSRLNRLQNESDWQGGFLCVADGETGVPHFIFGIGEIEDDRWEKCRDYCQEKARRLAAHPDHLSSFESRNEEQHQYGGAIRAGSLIFSFSGLPEELDESFVLELACHMQQLNTDGVREIIGRSGNFQLNFSLLP